MTRPTNRRSDSGASLLIVLLIVTSVSLVVGSVLSQADTNIRATVALRDQTSDNYAADAAAQAMITQVQNGTLPCSTPAGTTSSLGSGTSAPFYVPAVTQDGPINASAVCAPDTVNGITTTTTTTGSGVAITTANSPAYALLTVGTNPADNGQTYAGNNAACIAGGSVASNSTINLAGKGSKNALSVGADTPGTGCSVKADPAISVSAAGPTGCNGSVVDQQAGDFAVTACTHLANPIGLARWKAFAPVPTTPIGQVNPPALCYASGKTTFAAFAPGLYTSVGLLNTPCSQRAADFEWFTPGTYYFDYGATSWTWPSTLVGGTPQDASDSVIAALANFDVADSTPSNAAKLAALSAVTSFPGACADPSLQSRYAGVEFVLGGASSFTPSSSGRDEICATYSATSPPVAIYGIARDVIGSSSLSVAGGSVSAETLCDAPPCTSSSSGAQSLINTDANGQNSFFIQGYTYAPAARISLTFKNSAGQVFGWGAALRALDLTVNGATTTAPFIATIPADTAGTVTTTTTTYSIRYIEIWTCAAATTACPQTTPPDVRVKVQTNGSTVKVLAWSHGR